LVLLHVAKRPPLAQRLSSACGQAASAQRRTRALALAEVCVSWASSGRCC